MRLSVALSFRKVWIETGRPRPAFVRTEWLAARAQWWV
jgi:hypothetical protein